MKTRESWLQNGIFIYKTGLSVTKQEFHLQNRNLELQTGLSPYYLPFIVGITGVTGTIEVEEQQNGIGRVEKDV